MLEGGENQPVCILLLFCMQMVYVTATAPCLLLFILFIRGVTLPGAAMGIRYYMEPDFTRLAGYDVRAHCYDLAVFVCNNALTVYSEELLFLVSSTRMNPLCLFLCLDPCIRSENNLTKKSKLTCLLV